MKDKETKRKEANERQKEYDGLTKEQKLKLIKSRRGNSEKELKRVMEEK